MRGICPGNVLKYESTERKENSRMKRNGRPLQEQELGMVAGGQEAAKAPLLHIVPIPALRLDQIKVDFQMTNRESL